MGITYVYYSNEESGEERSAFNPAMTPVLLRTSEIGFTVSLIRTVGKHAIKRKTSQLGNPPHFVTIKDNVELLYE
jgi:hypothetical protein